VFNSALSKGTLVGFMALVFALSSGCAVEKHSMDMTAEVANAKTTEDHAKLADHYEEFAQEADDKAAMQQASLDAYLKKNYHGKQHEEMVFHCRSLISQYRDVAKTNRNIADIHRLQSTP
jgi:NifU-like protein involved in Fe-S cluster formation